LNSLHSKTPNTLKRLLIIVFTIYCYIFLSTVSAQTPIGQLEGLLAFGTGAFELELFTDKDPTGQSVPTYTIGNTIEMGITVGDNSFVYLFNIRSTGSITQLLPNAIDPHNSLSAGQSKFFPNKGAGYSFSVEGPTGLSKLIAIATKVPLETTSIVNFESPEAFFLTTLDSEDDFVANLEGLLGRLLPQDWVGDSVTFYVGQPSWLESDKTGTLFLKGNVGYASVFVNDELKGVLEPITGHLRLEELPVGEHELKVTADNHANYVTDFFINPDLTTELQVFQHPDR